MNLSQSLQLQLLSHSEPVDVGGDINQRPLSSFAGQGSRDLGVTKVLRHRVDAAADLHSRHRRASISQVRVGHGSDDSSGLPLGIGRVQNHRSLFIIGDEDDRSVVAGGDRNAVERCADCVRRSKRDSDRRRGCGIGGVESVELTVRAIGDEKSLFVGGGDESGEPVDGVVGGRLEVPRNGL
ncbi:putative trichothecene biosynthesis protein [Colletotrichum scovillei]|uniref:Trichothecene biosynthesis protein n=1 Tax=Colletotrichum scovillei TaxID=1209932 RepID=A0A9P7RBW8_9PEZI|nr:putative trichothecene biosynthesis protein [Colletotrichum scovillei]KAG7073960.1 putative trichothecene biosynthesis protein [Colletotrichum scovillei]KAG7081104.1 putative trichothecene biosynthesis protein [Colletotrichum scovillei]